MLGTSSPSLLTSAEKILIWRVVEANSGEDLTDYNLRRIGSDLEHFIRNLLQNGQISYNLNGRAINYSMGVPQVAVD